MWIILNKQNQKPSGDILVGYLYEKRDVALYPRIRMWNAHRKEGNKQEQSSYITLTPIPTSTKIWPQCFFFPAYISSQYDQFHFHANKYWYNH